MTQKELLYFEDAIGHIGNIIKIINESLKNISDERITTFLQNELTVHENLKEELLMKLKEKANG